MLLTICGVLFWILADVQMIAHTPEREKNPRYIAAPDWVKRADHTLYTWIGGVMIGIAIYRGIVGGGL